MFLQKATNGLYIDASILFSIFSLSLSLTLQSVVDLVGAVKLCLHTFVGLDYLQ